MRFTSLIALFGLIASAQATLTATFKSGEKSITQNLALPALLVTEGEPPAPGLAPGAFSATYKGTLSIPKRYRVSFSVEANGSLALKVNDEAVTFTEGKSERLRLNPGETPIEITFTSLENGTGSFRLFWEERREFPREPIPASAFISSDKAPLDAAHLFASHNCIQCHAADLGQAAMPELKYSGPNLTHIGDRTNEAWLTRWIAQPDLLKPTTTMPAMVDHTKPEGAQAAADLGAYLATLKTGKAINTKPDLTLAQKGGEHFHNLGCIACHSKTDADEPDFENGRVPLNNVATKFKDGALIAFLKNPQEHHEAIKMPNFRFSDEEASSLAAYLTKTSTGEHTPDPSEFPPGDAVRGQSLAASLNCAACHEGLAPSTAAAPKLSDLKNWTDQGCLGPDEKRGKSPRLNLTPEEKKTLTPSVLPALKHDTVEAYTARQIEALNCASCHDYNGQSSLISQTHGETKSLLDHIKEPDERLIQSRPPLTHMGAMLHTNYLEKMLHGKVEPRPRPWLDMRMPAFPLHAKHMAHGLGQHHGLAASVPSTEKPDADQVKLGEQLVGMTGYACVTCHAINEKPALAAFEVQGINFGQGHQRLRPGYFHQWMFNPARLVPDTKMPRYTNPDDGTGLRPDILDGDSHKQFEAVRQYLQSISK
ncbi:MAG: mono/diheme cytochrome c family protein [Akkermansiaceae bacterium]|jgi:mono/diheme cytochrome c family protein